MEPRNDYYLDDHSRMCLHGRFSFKGDLPAMELVFRRAIQKHGLPARVYFDNGAVYRSRHVRHVVACLGVHGLIFTRPRRPMGHGKIEAFNRLITSAFLAELPASRIVTLDELNEAWLAWADRYNRKDHGETGEPPRDRWRSRLAGIRVAPEDRVREAFLWNEPRTPDKSGIFSLLGTEYQVGPGLARRKIEVRYDPEDRSTVEAWLDGKLVERCRPLVVSRHRRPHAVAAPPGAGRPCTGRREGRLARAHHAPATRAVRGAPPPRCCATRSDGAATSRTRPPSTRSRRGSTPTSSTRAPCATSSPCTGPGTPSPPARSPTPSSSPTPATPTPGCCSTTSTARSRRTSDVQRRHPARARPRAAPVPLAPAFAAGSGGGVTRLGGSSPRRLRRRLPPVACGDHFALARLPFRKTMAQDDMFDSRAQRELYQALTMWSELHGIALVTGPSGAGKSITARRFARSLDESRCRVVALPHGVSTVNGFLRSLNRALELPMRQHASDLFDQAQAHLASHGPGRGPHPVIVIDDAEGMKAPVLDTVRRLTNHAIDAEDRFSVLVAGTDALLRTLRDPALEPFNTRLSFVHSLKPFNLEDTRNYVAFHLRLAGAREGLLADGAVRKLFQASGGVARRVNQLALHAMVQAAVAGLDTISADFMAQQLAAHPLYDSSGAG